MNSSRRSCNSRTGTHCHYQPVAVVVVIVAVAVVLGVVKGLVVMGVVILVVVALARSLSPAVLVVVDVVVIVVDRSILADTAGAIPRQQIRSYGLGVRVHAPPQCCRQRPACRRNPNQRCESLLVLQIFTIALTTTTTTTQ